MRYLFLLLLFAENVFALDGEVAGDSSSIAPISIVGRRPQRISFEASSKAFYGAEGRGPIETTNYLRAIYHFDPSTSVYVSPNYLIDFDTSSESHENGSEFGDVELGFEKKNFVNLGAERKTEASLRLYLPTGREQLDAGTKGKFHSRLIAKQSVTSSITAGLQSRFTWYNQTKNGQLNANGKMKANKSWVAFSFPFVSAKLTKEVTATLLSGWKYLEMRRVRSSKPTTPSSWVTDFSVWSDISDGVTFIVGVENDAQLEVKSRRTLLFVDEETKYYARVKIRM